MSPSKHRAPPVLIAPKPRNSNSEWHPNLTQRTKGGKSLLPSSMRWKAPICPSSRWRPKPFSCLRWTLPLCRAFLRSPEPPMPTALWPDRRRRRCRSRTRYTSRVGQTGRVSCALGSGCCGRACCLTWSTTPLPPSWPPGGFNPPPPPSLVPRGSHGWGMRGVTDSRDGEGVREKEVVGAGLF